MTLLGLLCLSPRALAAPVPEGERIPVDLRRTTLVVRDIDRSLPLYRDALGLKVIYDQIISGTTRLVLLRANDDFIGVLGLMQRLNLTGFVRRRTSPSPRRQNASTTRAPVATRFRFSSAPCGMPTATSSSSTRSWASRPAQSAERASPDRST
jgi:hypothetical protein